MVSVSAVRAGRERGAVFAGASAEAVATLLGAVGDGLLHVLLDPGLGVSAALDALPILLAPRLSEAPECNRAR